MNESYPRESVEPVFFDTLTVNGQVPVAADLEWQMTLGLERIVEANWQPVEEIDGDLGFTLTGGLEPSTYRVWVRVADTPFTPVIDAGRIRIT